MKSGTIVSKVFWVITHLGLIELFRRAGRYFKNYKITWLWVYRSQRHTYEIWLKNEAKSIKATLNSAALDMENYSERPLFSIVLTIKNLQAQYLVESIQSIFNQVYPSWEIYIICGPQPEKTVKEILSKHISLDNRIKIWSPNYEMENINGYLASTVKGSFIGFLDCGNILAPHALFEAAKLLNKNSDIDFIYSDEDHLEENNYRTAPFFKPDWSPDLLLSMNYIGNLFLVRKRLMREACGFSNGTNLGWNYDLVLRLTECTKKIAHIPKILHHSRQFPLPDLKDASDKDSGFKILESALKRRGLRGKVIKTSKGHYRIKYKVHGEPLISIIIPVRDKINLLRQCIRSIIEKSTYSNYEILVVDNGSIETESLSYFKEIERLHNCRVIHFDEPFNYSRINNFATKQARGDFLLFLNNDTEVITPDWLEEMLSHCQRREIGAVGVKLLFPDKRIQHGGVILGLRRVAMHAFYGLAIDDNGYKDLDSVIRNYSAVTAACLMMRKDVFDEIDGFDEELAVAYNDIDLCLRVKEKGYFIVWTPFALLYHHESASRGQYYPESNISYFRAKWQDYLEQGDPFYNPNLTLNYKDFRLRI